MAPAGPVNFNGAVFANFWINPFPKYLLKKTDFRLAMNVLSSSAPSGYKIIINNLNVLYDLNQNQNGS